MPAPWQDRVFVSSDDSRQTMAPPHPPIQGKAMQLISTGRFLGYTLEAYLPDHGPFDPVTVWAVNQGCVVAEYTCQRPSDCGADDLAWVLPTLRRMARHAATQLAEAPDLGQIGPSQSAARRRSPLCRHERPGVRRVTAPKPADQSRASTRVLVTTSTT